MFERSSTSSLTGFVVSHMFTRPSSPAVAKNLLQGENETLFIRPLCPLVCVSCWPRFEGCLRVILDLEPADTRYSPLGEKVTQFILTDPSDSVATLPPILVSQIEVVLSLLTEANTCALVGL